MDDVAYIDPETIGGTNLFAYCNNNPVMYVDPSGHAIISLSAIIIGAIIGAVVGLGTTAYNDYKSDGQLFNGNNWDYLFNGVLGAVTGAIGGTTSSFTSGLIISSALGAFSSIAEGVYSGEITTFWSWNTFSIGIKGALVSAISYTFSNFVGQIATNVKYKSIVGNNTSNNKINRALAKAGYNDLKIGIHGKSKILETLNKSNSVQAWGYFSGFAFDFITGMVNT